MVAVCRRVTLGSIFDEEVSLRFILGPLLGQHLTLWLQ